MLKVQELAIGTFFLALVQFAFSAPSSDEEGVRVDLHVPNWGGCSFSLGVNFVLVADLEHLGLVERHHNVIDDLA